MKRAQDGQIILVRCRAAAVAVLALCAGRADANPSATNRPLQIVHGHISRGERFEQNIGDDLVVVLEPEELGWHVEVRRQGDRSINAIGFASIATPPLHGPTPLDIEGWQFRNADNTASNHGDVNAPQLVRDFSFVLTEGDARRLADEINAFQEGKAADLPLDVPIGQGTVTIRNLKLGGLVRGTRAWIETMDFTVSLRPP